MPLLSYQQFREWQDYYSHDPWGEIRADQRQVVLLKTLLTMFAGSGDEKFPNPCFPYFENEPDADELMEWFATLPREISDGIVRENLDQPGRNDGDSQKGSEPRGE